jgi:hypothetical protein
MFASRGGVGRDEDEGEPSPIHPSTRPALHKPYRTTVTDFVVEKLSPRIRTM